MKTTVYLENVLEQNADKTEGTDGGNKTDIFRRVFSSNASNMMTTEELIETMKAMNNAHRANFFIRLKDKSYTVLKDLLPNQNNEELSFENAQDMLNKNAKNKVREEYLDNLLAFVDLDTLPERLNDKESVSFEYPNVLNMWCVASFTAIERENGIVTKVDFRV